MPGRGARMLNNDPSLSQIESSNEWKGRRFLIVTAVSAVGSAILGPFLFSLGAGMPRGSDSLPAVLFGSMFGGWVCLIPAILFGAIRRLRNYSVGSVVRTMFVFALAAA